MTAQGLVWSAPLKQYIAVDAGTGKDPQGHLVDGVFYSTSPDLIHWSPRHLLWQQQVFNNWQPGDPNPIGYVSLIDPTSHSRNFETVGPQPYLYFVRDRWSSGNMSRRDVHRIQVTFSSVAPTDR